MIIKIFNFINSFFGLIFILSFINYFNKAPIPSILSLIVGLLLIPKSYEFINKKIPLIDTKKRYFLIIILFFISSILFPTNKRQDIDKKANNNTVKNISTTTPTKSNKIDITPVFTLTPTTIKDNNSPLYLVTKVVDGDTIDVNIDNQVKRIRIIGINTPEVVDPRKTVECFGREASNKAKNTLLGKKIRLEEDSTQGNTDKYGRLLRYVFLEDGTDFGLLMIKEGYAYEYTYNIPYKYQSQYKEAQNYAMNNKLGLWADNICNTRPSINTSNNNSINNSNYSCGTKKYCTQMTSCDEAYFYLNNCGLSKLDADKDGIPCENICQ